MLNYHYNHFLSDVSISKTTKTYQWKDLTNLVSEKRFNQTYKIDQKYKPSSILLLFMNILDYCY